MVNGKNLNPLYLHIKGDTVIGHPVYFFLLQYFECDIRVFIIL